MTMTRNIILLTVLLIILESMNVAHSQTTIGIQPLGSYANGGIDQVSESDLGLHIDIPLFQHNARGNGQGTRVHLIYDSGYVGGSNPVVDLGWRMALGTAKSGRVLVTQNSKEWWPLCDPGVTHCNIGYYNYTYSFEFLDSTGHTHQFINGSAVTSVQCVGSNPNQPCNNAYLAVNSNAYDNSGYFLSVNNGVQSATPANVTVIAPSGEAYTWGGSGSFSDTNGNTGSSSASEGGYWVDWSTTLTDNTNIAAMITGGAYSSSTYTSWTSRHPLAVRYYDTSGNLQPITVNYVLQTIGYSCPSSGFSFSQIVGLIHSVVYPDGTSYTFTYTSTGALSSIQLPQGGTITYTGNLGLAASCGIGLPASLTRSTPDGSTSYTQTINSTQNGNSSIPATSTTTISHPDGNSEKINFVYVADFDSTSNTYNKYMYETSHMWLSSTGSILKSNMRCYNNSTGTCTVTPISLPIAKITTTITLDNGIASKTVQQMNSAGLTTELDEYDYGATSPTRKTLTTYASLGNRIIDRPSSVAVYDSSGNTARQTTYGYDEYPITPLTLPGHNAVSGARGNLTSQHAWLNTTGTTLDSHLQYDDAGQVLAAQDPRQYWTYYGYDSVTDSCRTSTTPPTPSSGVSQAASSSCDSDTGLLASSTDANGVKTSYAYDEMLRPNGTTVTSASGTTAAHTSRSYSGSSLPATITTTITATPSPDQVSTTVLDGLGRIVTATGANGAKVSTTYNAMGYVKSVTNPYFSTSDLTYGIMSYLYDGLGRKTYQCQPDNSTSSSTTCSPASSYQSWVYAGNSIVFKDEAGNQWEDWMDGLGRLSEVMEPNGSSKTPSMETDYAYDALNDLVSVTQWGGAHGSSGARTRAFTYDSLSRLTQSYNPETNWICYGATTSGAGANGSNCKSAYDANGNLLAKTDARGKALSMTYDALDRITAKSASDGSLSYTYSYDNTTYGSSGIGRLFGAFAGSTSGEGYYYDSMGRVIGQSYQTPSLAGGWQQAFNAIYNLAGNLTQFTYPDGRIINQAVDSAGHLTSITYTSYNGQAVNYNYLASASYSPTGTVQAMTLGNGVVTTNSYNNRLQMAEVKSGGSSNGYNQSYLDKQFCYGPAGTGVCTMMGGGKNNGNIWAIPDILNSNTSQAFAYDTLNRISGLANGSGSMQQNYSIDSFGNLSQSGTLSQIVSFGLNNQINSGGVVYDPAGNEISFNNGVAITSYAYDADERMINVNNGSSATYTYNPEGQRVRKDIPGDWTEYLYFGGRPMAEKRSDGSWSDYMFANGQRIARADSFDRRIHIHGTTNTAGSWAAWSLPITAFTVQGGDKISWRQYQSGGARGGINIGFSDGTGTGWVTKDSSGQVINSDTVEGSWLNRTVDLSSYAGKTLNSLWVVTDAATPVGTWDNYFNDIAFVKMNGTVTPLYARDTSAPLTYHYGGSISNQSGIVETANATADAAQPEETTTYYHPDQIGSARLLTAAGGWPVWSDTFYPFGQESSAVSATNHDRYTGKERDTESGNDYFGARYYASSMGRMMSPDYSDEDDGLQAIPYYNPSNPQSLNLYSYVHNNPLTGVDPDGHDCVVQTRTSNTTESFSVSSGTCAGVNVGDGQSATYVNGTVTGVTAGSDGHSIDIGFNSYDGQSSGVQNAGGAPIPDNPGIAPGWGNNQQGYNTLGTASATVGSVKGVAAFYGASALGAAGAYAVGLTAGADLTTLGSLAGETAHSEEAALLARHGITPEQARAAIEAAKQSGNVVEAMGRYGPQLRYTANGIRVVVATTGRNAGKIITAFFK